MAFTCEVVFAQGCYNVLTRGEKWDQMRIYFLFNEEIIIIIILYSHRFTHTAVTVETVGKLSRYEIIRGW